MTNLTKQIAERMEPIALFEIAPGKCWQPDVDQLVPLAQASIAVIREWLVRDEVIELAARTAHNTQQLVCRNGTKEALKAISQALPHIEKGEL